MTNVVKAGGAYFAMVFATAFLLGTLRVTLLVPRLGELGGFAIELPLLLVYSWLACGLIVRRFAVSGAWSDRLAMGAIAFALLMAAEFAVSTSVFGRSASEFFGAMATTAGALGLAAQVAFAAMPVLRRMAGAH
jgi:hypothetical protein